MEAAWLAQGGLQGRRLKWQDVRNRWEVDNLVCATWADPGRRHGTVEVASLGHGRIQRFSDTRATRKDDFLQQKSRSKYGGKLAELYQEFWAEEALAATLK